MEKALDPEWWIGTVAGKIVTAGGLMRAPVSLMVNRIGRPLFNWLSDYNSVLENAVRLAAYNEARIAGLSREQSASLAKNLTVNFNRKGELAVQMGALYAFFNASVQGTARLVETLRGQAGKQIVAGGILLGVVQALALMAAGFDDDDEPPQFVRERNLIIPTGLVSGQQDYITVPMPLGLHVLPNIGRLLVEGLRSGDHSKNLFSAIGLVMEAFNPVGGSAPLAQIVAPTVIDPMVALSMNEDWNGRPIAREDFNSLKPTPGFTRARDVASAPSRLVAEAINTLTGGDRFIPGAVSPTPDQIDFLVAQLTGGVGREAMKAGASVTALAGDEELPPHRIPLLGRFYGSAEGQAPQANKFWSNVKKINLHAAKVDGLFEERRGDEARAYARENPLVRLEQMSSRAQRTISILKKTKRMLAARDDPDEARMREIEDKITQQMMMLNERVQSLDAMRNN
jgi:hypothetical protein